MKLISSTVDKVKTEKQCSFVVGVFEGTQITMYGEIVDGNPDMSSVAPSFWNDREFRELHNDVQKQIIQITKEALQQLAG